MRVSEQPGYNSKYARRWRERNPHKAAYARLKGNAKRRGKTFTLTFVQFLCIEYIDYYVLYRGKGQGSLTLDRINPGLGYVEGNIQVMTNTANNEKRRFEYDPPTTYPELNPDIVAPF